MDRLIVLITLLAFSFSTFSREKIIYGDDNRVDVYASTNSDFVELSKSTAAMINKRSVKLSKDKKTYKISTFNFGTRMNACKDERFFNQPIAASCSGFLVGEDLLVTAGHCVTSARDCKSSSWVFNYKMKNETEANLDISTDNVYSCSKIISRSLDNQTQNDYALIKLDRKAKNITPLKFRTSGKVKKKTKLVVIGHPSGLPTKIADGASVRKVNNVFFTANLDTYGGNSGSAVFNIATGDVEGILVRGGKDYSNRGGCRVSNRVGNRFGGGEGVTLITNIKELMNL